ncbi:lipoprotein [Leptospira noumeaensis]|uniref:Lipoprotein n=1 Tax=Leptospira noumeaensis TaxID=2484964 RepID=A0A4V3JKN4_9LEPT|nr:lipoprotein [Leptospira noumeaensis]TGK87022.1 lipoprotein [Leptospira noumeaensis]
MNKTISRMILSFAILTFVWSCKSKETKEVPQTKDTENEVILEFTKAKEGFLSESLFQVAVSSVLPSESERTEEAKTIAEQKSLNLLKTFTIPNLSDKGRKELREISKEGKIVDKNVSVGGRYFFLYQIQKPNLKRLVTKDLE